MTLPQLQNQGSGRLGPFCQLIYEKTLTYTKLQIKHSEEHSTLILAKTWVSFIVHVNIQPFN
jgi:hypothetical protein